MGLKFYDSPFHATHSDKMASKIAMKTDLSILLSHLIKEKYWKQEVAAEKLKISRLRVSDLMNTKIDVFTVDALFDMFDALGYRVRCVMTSLD